MRGRGIRDAGIGLSRLGCGGYGRGGWWWIGCWGLELMGEGDGEGMEGLGGDGFEGWVPLRLGVGVGFTDY